MVNTIPTNDNTTPMMDNTSKTTLAVEVNSHPSVLVQMSCKKCNIDPSTEDTAGVKHTYMYMYRQS